MNVKEYYSDVKKKRVELEESFESGEIFVMSVFQREKNSAAGQVCTVSPGNAARVIVDGTHRLATDEEVATYRRYLEKNRLSIAKTEQLKKQQFLVVVDPKDTVSSLSAASGE